MYDPLAMAEEILNAPLRRQSIRSAQPMLQQFDPLSQLAMEDMPPESAIDALDPEQQSFASRVIHGGLSGIGYVGASLDKPARALRSVLGLPLGKSHLRDVLSFIPFSDAIGITDPEQAVSGGDLLGTSDNEGLGYRALEFGAEVALDPLTYFTLGGSAYGKGGKAAKAAGLSDEIIDAGKAAGKGKRQTRIEMTARDVIDSPSTRMTQAEKMSRFREAVAAKEKVAPQSLSQDVLDSYLNESIGSFARGSVPFTNIDVAIGTGQKASQYAKRLDDLGASVAGSKAGLWASKTFRPSAMQASTAEGQQVARDLYRDLKTSRERIIKTAMDDAQRLSRLGKTSMADSDRIRTLAEMRQKYADLGQTISQVDPELGGMVQSQIDELDSLLTKSKEIGVNIDGLSDETAAYYPRYVTDLLTNKGRAKAGKAKYNRSFDPSAIGREDYLKNWAGDDYQGTASIRQVVMDVQSQMPTFEQAATDPADLKDMIAGYIEQVHGAKIGEHELGSDVVADKMAKFIMEMDDEVRQAGGFGNHAVADWMRRLTSGEDAYLRTQKVVDFLADAKNLRTGNQIGDGKWVKLSSLLAGKNAIGTIAGGGALNIRTGTRESGGATNYILSKLHGIDLNDFAGMDDEAYKQLKDTLGDYSIPVEVAEDLKRIIDLPSSPSELNVVRDIFDSYTSLFKAGVLTWPARFVRDFTSAIYQNHLIGGASKQGYKDAWNLLHGKDIDITDAPWIKKALAEKGLPVTPDNARDELRSLLASFEMVDKYQGPVSQIASNPNTPRLGPQSLEDLLDLAPGRQSVRLRDIARSAFDFSTPESRNPLNIRGVGIGDGVRLETKFAPARAGEDLGYFTETVNRVAPFVTLLRKGLSPDEAAAKVMATQVDYKPRNFSVAEREYLTRMFPFYRFTSRQIPFQLNEIMNKPAGTVGKTIRGIRVMQDEDMALPEHISQTAAVPIGGAPEGFQRFITGFGLPFEDALGLFRPGANSYKTVQGTLQEFGGRLHPIPKALAELMSGVQLFSGRDMQDLRGATSDIMQNLGITDSPANTPILLEQAISSSPLSRMASTARTLTDPRKGLGAKATQLLTGIRLTDTDIEKSRNLALRNYLEDLLRQNPSVRRFSHLYAPDMSQLSDEDAALMQLYKDLGAQSAKISRKRKKAEKSEAQRREAENILQSAGL